jgi:diguanylate cyclase (GGDEF)-like protein
VNRALKFDRARNLFKPGVNNIPALFHCIDSMLLFGFALTGAIGLYVPFAYLLVGLAECLSSYWMTRRAARLNISDTYQDYRHLITCGVVLMFLALNPQIGFFFMMGLFMVCGVSINLPARQFVLTWLGSTIGIALIMAPHRDISWMPQSNTAQRILVWLSYSAGLARCALLEAFNRATRVSLRERSLALGHSNAKLQHQATHDALTGLPNRVLFSERLRQAALEGHPFAVCVLDLDRFKIVNDSLGHSVGDALLSFVAQRLRNATRGGDTVARAGGDEFLLLLREVSSTEEIEILAKRWMQALAEPCRVHDTTIHVSPSIGIARSPSDGTDEKALLARADEAMYYAKQSGRNTFRLYDAHTMGFSSERFVIETELRDALQEPQFVLHYQPKMDVVSGETRSVEALIRWEHPTRGRMQPEQFISIAEESGLILPVGAWVIGEACRQARQWQLQGMPFLRIAVNVSPKQFRQPNFVSIVRDALARNELDAYYLELELTEATLMLNTEKSVATLESLSRLGVIVAIDDFGMGGSNMSFLKRLPIDKLKIDRSFVRDLHTNTEDASIVQAIIALAHGHCLKVVAEGVESLEQFELLKHMGCDQYQGSLRSAAVSAAEIELFMESARNNATAIDPHAGRTLSKLACLPGGTVDGDVRAGNE